MTSAGEETVPDRGTGATRAGSDDSGTSAPNDHDLRSSGQTLKRAAAEPDGREPAVDPEMTVCLNVDGTLPVAPATRDAALGSGNVKPTQPPDPSMARPQPSWQPGDWFPADSRRYQLQVCLGSGGFGTVFRAHDRVVDVDVAIKLLHRKLSANSGAIEALRNGVRKTLKFNHENLIKIFHFDIVDGCAFVVMELLQGKPLDQMMREDFATGMPLEKAWSIIEGAGQGLDYLHRHGVVHSDLKPANVFVTAGGVAKVLDFDLSRAFRDVEGSRPVAERLMGITPRYASPEMLQGRPASVRDDVFSFGVLAYELIAGRNPFLEICGDQPLDGLTAMGLGGKKLVVPPITSLRGAQNEALAGALCLDTNARTGRIVDVLARLNPGRKGFESKWILVAGGATIVIAAVLATARFGGETRGPAPSLEAAPVGGPVDGQVFQDCKGCPKMVAIPGGSFTMGSPVGEVGRDPDEGPQHMVRVARFAIGVVHVTRGEFEKFVSESHYQGADACRVWNGEAWTERTGANWSHPGFPQNDDHPAVCVNWADAQAYASWLSQKTGMKYRLPSEAEWEYAARAGTTGARWWGDNSGNACIYANVMDRTGKEQVPGVTSEIHECTDHWGYTAPVASYEANPFRLHDMLGNAWQWTEDCYHSNYSGVLADGSAWTSDACPGHVLRGGSWIDFPDVVRSAIRVRSESSVRAGNIGFRVARTLP